MTSVDEILYAPITPAEAPIIKGLETVSLADLVDQGADNSAAYYHDWQNQFALANVQGLGSLANLAQVQGLPQNFNHLQQAQNLQSLAYQSQMNMPQGWRNPTTFEQAIRQIEALIS